MNHLPSVSNNMKSTACQADRQVLAIIVASPLTQNIYDRIGVDVFSPFFKVVIIDCLDWVRHGGQTLIYKGIEYQSIHKAGDESKFRQVFECESPSFVLDFIGRGQHTRRIQDICREYNAIYIMQLLTPAPNPISQSSLLQSFRMHPVETLAKAVRYLMRKVFEPKLRPPDIALLAGTASNSGWTDQAAKRFHTATPDYFDLLRVKKQAGESKLPPDGLPAWDYILFIDDCLAMSFDFVLGVYRPIFEATEYFAMINEVFSRLEKYFMLPIVVAAHPNGKEFPGYQQLFGSRTVLFDATGRLTLNCSFAVTHYSSAISYAVLLRKKILLLNSKKIKKMHQGMVIDYILMQLQCGQVEMDGDSDASALRKFAKMAVSESSYRTYEKKYIKDVEMPGRHPFEHLLEHLVAAGR